MAQPTATHDRYDLAATGDNVREDFSDAIYNISPTETPFISKICGRGTMSNSFKDWSIDELDTVDGSNAYIDGDEFAAQTDTANAASKLTNYAQISRKHITVTRRANKVNKAGRKSELAYQLGKKGKELKRDMETILTGVQIVVVGDGTTAPNTAALGAWYSTNVDRGTNGTSATLSSTTYGYPSVAVTDGTLRAMTETEFLALIKDAYVAGGNPDCVLVHPTMKQRFSTYMFSSSARIATQYQDQGSSAKRGITTIGAVDYYVSDFGVLEIMPDRFQRDRDVHILDKSMWSVDYLDGFRTDVISKSGDTEKRMVLADYMLRSNNEAASAILADVDATTAMTA